MKRFLSVPLSVALVLLLVPQTYAQQEEEIPEVPLLTLKQNIAVFQFENKTASPYAVGTGMADMLVTALVKSGRYIVIERQQLESVIQEQGLGLAGAITPESAAQVGQLIGVDLAVFGSITAFGDEKRRVGIGALAVTRSRARVVADVRFVNTTTGEILYAESVEGTESQLGIFIDTEDIDFSSVETWRDTRIGKAASECAEKIVRYSSERVANAPWHGTLISMAEDGPFCYIKPGAVSGLQRGNILYVYHKGPELIDPDLGISLGSEETLTGRIQVLDPNIGDGKASKCLILEGTGFARGDLIKIK
ncbi:MAG: hypothetical protein KAT18_05745 [Candidatus Latescibacteria bacterium]|nr:hypothetical protein [Candidatus Latescibacterota bacterium]